MADADSVGARLGHRDEEEAQAVGEHPGRHALALHEELHLRPGNGIGLRPAGSGVGRFHHHAPDHLGLGAGGQKGEEAHECRYLTQQPAPVSSGHAFPWILLSPCTPIRVC